MTKLHVVGEGKRNEPVIPIQSASMEIWDRKYRLKKNNGDVVDETIASTYERVATALADVESTAQARKRWREEFLWALENGATPAGRIISNAGAQDYKPATSTINCTVAGTIRDSMDGILHAVHLAGLTLKSGAGIGYEFSTLRPKGAYVRGAGSSTSGPLSFMDIFNAMCFTVSSAGGRRGAQMGTFDIGHPDIMDFIRAKRENGRLRQFNLSCLITDEFMKAVEEDQPWDLVFPAVGEELNDPDVRVVWRRWPLIEKEYQVRDGLVACRVYRTLPARRLWDVIMSSTYDYADPGFILIDKINEMNNLWFAEFIRATNPCGEQPLPPWGSCLLGSINLTKFVLDPFTPKARLDWERFKRVVAIFTRMLDNVVELNGLPLEQQRAEILRKRRHGMGYLGLGSAMTMLQMKYGDETSLRFTDEVAKTLAITGWETGIELAKEKGAARQSSRRTSRSPRRCFHGVLTFEACLRLAM